MALEVRGPPSSPLPSMSASTQEPRKQSCCPCPRLTLTPCTRQSSRKSQWWNALWLCTAGTPIGIIPTSWGVGARWLLLSAATAHKGAGRHHCSMGVDAPQGRATESTCFLQASTAFRRGMMCLCSPKSTLRSLLGQEAPGFPLAPGFSSLEAGHLKLFEDFAVGG